MIVERPVRRLSEERHKILAARVLWTILWGSAPMTDDEDWQQHCAEFDALCCSTVRDHLADALLAFHHVWNVPPSCAFS